MADMESRIMSSEAMQMLILDQRRRRGTDIHSEPLRDIPPAPRGFSVRRLLCRWFNHHRARRLNWWEDRKGQRVVANWCPHCGRAWIGYLPPMAPPPRPGRKVRTAYDAADEWLRDQERRRAQDA